VQGGNCNCPLPLLCPWFIRDLPITIVSHSTCFEMIFAKSWHGQLFSLNTSTGQLVNQLTPLLTMGRGLGNECFVGLPSVGSGVKPQSPTHWVTPKPNSQKGPVPSVLECTYCICTHKTFYIFVPPNTVSITLETLLVMYDHYVVCASCLTNCKLSE